MTAKHSEAQQKYLQSKLENSKVNCNVWAAAVWDTITAAIRFQMPVFIRAASRQCWMCPSYNYCWDQSTCIQHSVSYILVILVQFNSIMSNTYCSWWRTRVGANVTEMTDMKIKMDTEEHIQVINVYARMYFKWICFCVLPSTF
jgi:hypothetical protein